MAIVRCVSCSEGGVLWNKRKGYLRPLRKPFLSDCGWYAPSDSTAAPWVSQIFPSICQMRRPLMFLFVCACCRDYFRSGLRQSGVMRTWAVYYYTINSMTAGSSSGRLVCHYLLSFLGLYYLKERGVLTAGALRAALVS